MTAWVSVKERMPEKSGRYLVYVKGRQLKFRCFHKGYFYKEAIFWRMEDLPNLKPLKKVTHWAKLNPPEGE